MGMYDTLNGEQVKCFPWYSCDVMSLSPEGSIGGHGGNLKYYGNGSEIPYRSLAYNYGKNFIIFDFNPALDPNDGSDWVAHVIKDGLLKASVYKENAGDEFEEILKKNRKNISYYGGGNFKFKSIADVNQYAVESDELMKKIKELHKPVDKIMREWMDALKEGKYRNLKKGTPEYEELSSRLDDQFSAKYDAENKKVKPIIGKLRQEFAKKWTESESEYYLKMSDFGECIEAGILTLKCKKEQEKEPKEKIALAKKHGIFFDRQKELQYYCEYFKKTYGKMLEKEGEEFWKKYFEWCEITDEEREKVDELRKELGV